MVALTVGRSGGGVTADAYWVSLWDDENVVGLDRVMVVQPCQYTKKYLIVHFKMVTFVVCYSYLFRAVLKIVPAYCKPFQ